MSIDLAPTAAPGGVPWDSGSTCIRPAQEPSLAVAGAGSARHVIDLPARPGRRGHWPKWLPPQVRAAYEGRGITAPWQHQSDTAELAWAGHNVGLVTGTASGKSAAFGMPGLAATLEPAGDARRRGACLLYLSPTKALAQDQLGGLQALGLPGLRAATYDGDTPRESRAWARAHARWLITNPDMLHRSLLPDHDRWRSFLGNLRFVVVDEAHAYRGVFGAHVALVLRRLLRIAEHHGATPTAILTSATIGSPDAHLSGLLGRPVEVISADASARAPVRLVFWQPAPPEEGGGPRRGAVSEAAALAAHMIDAGRQTLVFARSRRGAEAVAQALRNAGINPRSVAAYRGGYLPEERRELERGLREGRLVGLAATSALELGIDISGLDAVVIAGWPGSRASFLQQSGRAGRRGRGATAILVAREDPLDQYLVEHPELVVGPPIETAQFNTGNPYVLAPHLAAAAAEIPLADAELSQTFGPTAQPVCQALARRGLLRHRTRAWYWTSADRASDLTDLRGAGGPVVRIVEEHTGRMLGTADRARAPGEVHEGAIYTHQGTTYLVTSLDLDGSVALATRVQVDYDTVARQVSTTTLGDEHDCDSWSGVTVTTGEVEVTTQVVSYLKRRWPGGEVLGAHPLDLPSSLLPTTATWWTFAPDLLGNYGIGPADAPGALHAAEHAAIAMLPLIATCDRWDIGGVSTQCHPQTGQPTIVVYDGAAGGAGFAAAGFAQLSQWMSATAAMVGQCRCLDGCPSCVQSPKCGNGNNPLDKRGAELLLGLMANQST